MNQIGATAIAAKRSRNRASAAILAWITLLLLGATVASASNVRSHSPASTATAAR
jgi:hypothetical protein